MVHVISIAGASQSCTNDSFLETSCSGGITESEQDVCATRTHYKFTCIVSHLPAYSEFSLVTSNYYE